MSAEELRRVRTKFVETVSGDMIKQLLDDLLDEGVLNEGEKDSILEENDRKTDRARAVIDTVKRKGDEASVILITSIRTRDQHLSKALGLMCPSPAQPAAASDQEQKWSSELIPTTDAFWSNKQNNKDNYPATKESIRNRVALLITNIEFTDPDMNRRGSEKDEENMEILLKALGYEVVKHTNKTGKEIDDALIKFSQHPKLKKTDSVMVVIMSHGLLGAVCGVNYNKNDENPDVFPINNIYIHLGSEKCPALHDKPKIIIIQACRGAKAGAVLMSDGANPHMMCDNVEQPGPPQSTGGGNLEEDTVRFVHNEKDFSSLLSCTPDTVSYRRPDTGSLLVMTIVKVFNTFAHRDHIGELFRQVQLRFDPSSSGTSPFEPLPFGNKRQMPTLDRSTLLRHFHFFPGL